MPANTSPYGLPYPLPTEPVAEGAQAIRNLAEATDDLIAGKLVQLIERKTLSADGSFDFTGIPATFQALRIVASILNTGATFDDLRMQVNGQTAASYHTQYLAVDGSAIGATRINSQTVARIGSTYGAVSFASAFGHLELTFPNYRSGYAHWHAISHRLFPGLGPILEMTGGHYQGAGASPVTRINIFGSATPLASGSVASLYGLP